MKKAIILNTSPRTDGNCDLVAQRVAARLEALGMEVDAIDFKKVKINYCQACDACKSKDVPWCIQKDDWSELIPRLDACDVFVVLTPIYFGTYTAQAKTMLDRMYPWFNPKAEHMTLTQKPGKKILVLTTSGASPVEEGEAAARAIAGPAAIAGFTENRVLAVNNVNPKGAAMQDEDYLSILDDMVDWLSE